MCLVGQRRSNEVLFISVICCSSQLSSKANFRSGSKAVSDLLPGDEVATLDRNGAIMWSPFVVDWHRGPGKSSRFLQIVTENEEPLCEFHQFDDPFSDKFIGKSWSQTSRRITFLPAEAARMDG